MKGCIPRYKTFTHNSVFFNILIIFGILLLTTPISATKNEVYTEQLKNAAISAANYEIDRLWKVGFENLPHRGTKGPDRVKINENIFDVLMTFCPNGSFCDEQNNRHVKVEVFYNGDHVHILDTVLTP